MDIILILAAAAGLITFGWLLRDSTLPVPEYDSPDGTYPKKDGG